MELENQSAKQTYIKLMADALQKKTAVLKSLIELTRQQEIIITSDNINEEDFDQNISQKEIKIKELTALDDGFEQLFESVREELSFHRELYSEDIKNLQELILTITNLSVELQAIEKRNKLRMETYFSNKRKNIRNSKISSKAVSNYYKTMTKQREPQSLFYDKKK